MRVERRPGEELPPILAERPRRYDTQLAGLRHTVDAGGHAAQHDVSAALTADGERTGAVDGGPDDLGHGVIQDDRCRVERLAGGDEADAYLEAVIASAAHVALAELGASPARRRA